MFVCKAGHMVIKKKYEERKGQDKYPRIKFFFDIEKCKVVYSVRGGLKKEKKVRHTQ
jgi:hypothetical protein